MTAGVPRNTKRRVSNQRAQTRMAPPPTKVKEEVEAKPAVSKFALFMLLFVVVGPIVFQMLKVFLE